MADLHRDGLTWLAYALLAWFAFLQAAPGLILVPLRAELDLSFSAGGLLVAAFAAGSTVASAVAGWLERALGRRPLLLLATAVLGAGVLGLTAGRTAAAVIGAVLVMGVGGGLVLVTVQAVLADRHGEHRAVALAEANVAASAAYLLLVAALALATALAVGWRAALLAALAVPLLTWWTARRVAVPTPPPPPVARGRMPGAFWLAAGVLFCATAAEWCTTAWAATFVAGATGAPTPVVVALMAGYFGGVLAGRVLGSGLARRHDPAHLLAGALVVAAGGFAVLWWATAPGPALAGLMLLGIGLGNLFPMGLAVAVRAAPDRAGAASGRAVGVTSVATLLAPLTVGALADATSLAAALLVVPACLALAAAGLALVRRPA